MVTTTDLIAVLPQLVLILSAGLLLVLEAFLPGPARRSGAVLSMLAAAGAAWCRLAFLVSDEVWSGMLRIDGLSTFVDLYILAALFLTAWMAGPFLRRIGHERGEFFVLLLLAASGAMIMASSADLVPLFLGLELLSIPLYVLNAFIRKAAISVEAGLKYFIVGAFSAAILVYGMALLYGTSASTRLDAVLEAAAANAGDPLVVIGLVMVFGGMAFKLALFPFHAWAPDVYQGSPTPVTAFLSVVPKGAALIVVLRIALGADLFHLDTRWLWIIGAMAVASQALGNIVAIVQRDIKRMLAYSGIAHMGYALVGVAAVGSDGSAGVLVYLAAYTVMNVGAFAAVALMSEREDEPHLISDLAGQGWRRPVVALALTICLFSLAGVPPFVGFAAKFMVFRSAVNEGLIWLAVLGVVNSLISAFFYLRVVYVMYMQPLPRREPAFERSLTLAAVSAISALAVVAVGVWPAPLLQAAEVAAAFLVR